MKNYTFRKNADMQLILSEDHSNGPAVIRLYMGRYFQRGLLNTCIFHIINRRIRKTGTVAIIWYTMGDKGMSE
jgi:hypothetical protein